MDALQGVGWGLGGGGSSGGMDVIGLGGVGGLELGVEAVVVGAGELGDGS